MITIQIENPLTETKDKVQMLNQFNYIIEVISQCKNLNEAKLILPSLKQECNMFHLYVGGNHIAVHLDSTVSENYNRILFIY